MTDVITANCLADGAVGLGASDGGRRRSPSFREGLDQRSAGSDIR